MNNIDNNVIVSSELKNEVMVKKYLVYSIESDIIPDGAMIGIPATIVTLDNHQYDGNTSRLMSALDIVNETSESQSVLLQGHLGDNLDTLIHLLHENNKFVIGKIESGICNVDNINPDLDWVHFIHDGQPSVEYNLSDEQLPLIGEFTFHVDEKFKYEDIPDNIRQLPQGSVWLQPLFDSDENFELAADLAIKHNLRVGARL